MMMMVVDGRHQIHDDDDYADEKNNNNNNGTADGIKGATDALLASYYYSQTRMQYTCAIVKA